MGIGSYCFRKSTQYILNKCNMLDAKQLITYSSIMFIKKLIINKIPYSNYNLYQTQNRVAKSKILRTKYKPKSKRLKNHIVHKGAELLNNIPSEINSLNIRQFKKRVRDYVKCNNLW